MGLLGVAKKIFGSSNERRLKPLRARVEAVNALEETISQLSDSDLAGQTEKFRRRLQDGATTDSLLEEAFATVREAARRALGQRHYDVQLLGGMVLHRGDIAEMKTGEGKTLVATLPAYLNALSGKGVHVVTVNDYLVRRDAEWMGRVYERLGMTTGCIAHGIPDGERREAYACDITYGTNNEFGFDYLRDNMKSSLDQMVQRGHHYAIVDEVDSILIDEARTPLIISGPAEDKSGLYRKIDGLIPSLEDTDYEIDEKQRSVTFTEEGNERIESILEENGLLEKGGLYDSSNISVVHHVNQALKAHKIFQKDRDYIVRNNRVVIIDEFTGRMMEGRRWSDGLHQAVEAKENAEIQPENQTLASITFQNYFRLYEKMGGMTGTAVTEEAEFADIYGLGVYEIPTNRPVVRDDLEDKIYRTADQKYRAIVTQIADCYRRGQPVLAGTVSIEKSEHLSGLLGDRKFFAELARSLRARAGEIRDKDASAAEETEENAAFLEKLGKKKIPVPHTVLNARYHEQEAEIVANAGTPGAVTIATNMAGRGTDIQLGGCVDKAVMDRLEDGDDEEAVRRKRKEAQAGVETARKEVLDAGGLYVLSTERHESRRIDNQLRGRSGRQGDPGTTKFFLSLEDDLMRIFATGMMDRALRMPGDTADESVEHVWITKCIETAQKKVEQRNYDVRKNILKFDDVINDQRKAVFEQRIDFMSTENVNEVIGDMREQLVEDTVRNHIPEKSYPEQWDTDGLGRELKEIFGTAFPVDRWAAEEGVADTEIRDRLLEETGKISAARAAQIGPDVMRRLEKVVLLNVIDTNWREHLQMLDHLRATIWLRGHGQRDPVNEFKTEAFGLFESLLAGLRRGVVCTLMNVSVRTPESAVPDPAPDPGSVTAIHPDPATGLDGTNAPRKSTTGFVRKNAAAGINTMNARMRAATIDPENPETWGRVPRNAPCLCGSGKKFKHCCGAVSAGKAVRAGQAAKAP